MAFQKSKFKQSATWHGEPRTQLPNMSGSDPEQSEPRRVTRSATTAARVADATRAVCQTATSSASRTRQAAAGVCDAS